MNARAVSADFKQCETKRVLLGTEYATDKPFFVFRNPITPPVLDDFKMVRCQCRQRREAGHVLSTNLVNTVLFSSTSINVPITVRVRDGFQ